MNKQSLRDEATRKRAELTSAEIREYSELITPRLIAILQKNTPSNIHVYVSRRAEPWTIELIEWLLANDYGVYVPVLHGQNMYCKKVSDDTPLSIFKDPIAQSESTACEHTESLDVVIVPTLCFDSAGNRLGYGKGFYDKFLAKHPTAMTIGLCYESNKITAIPAEPHDIRLDIVISEEAIYQYV